MKLLPSLSLLLFPFSASWHSQTYIPMIKLLCLALLVSFLAQVRSISIGPDDLRIGKSDPNLGIWGYTEVRKGAHLFWWLFPGEGNSSPIEADVPIVLWLQVRSWLHRDHQTLMIRRITCKKVF